MDRGDLRRRLAGALETIGLLSPMVRLRERWIAARAPDEPVADPDGLPIPPARIRILVDGHGDPDGFVEDATAAATMIRETVARAGVELGDLGSILDFGCGCGRIARHWSELRGPRLCGCDYNPELVAWCRENLPFMDVQVNDPAPPSPYPDDRFDLVYAISILTHMTPPLGAAWIADFTRILRPGGLLLVTTHGDSFRERLTQRERSRYDGGHVVVQRARMEGTNTCAAYHPPAYVRERLLGGLDLVGFAGHDPAPEFPQDVYLAQVSSRGPSDTS